MQNKKTKSGLTKKNIGKVAKKELKNVKKEVIVGGKTVANTVKEFPKKVSMYDWANFKTDTIGAFKNLWESLVNPKQQFNAIKEDGKYDKEVIKTAIYGIFGALIILVFSLLSGDFGISTILKLIYVPIGAIMVLFGFAGFINMFSYYCKGSVNFEIAVKATAEKMYLLPLIILANILLSFDSNIFLVQSLLVDLYILYMTYSFIIFGAKGNKNLTQVVFAVFALLLFIGYFTNHGDLWLNFKNNSMMF